MKFKKMVTMTLYAAAAAAKSLQSYRTLCDPIDSSPPGSSVHGILQARVLEWGAIAFSNNPVYETAKETLMYRTVFWNLIFFKDENTS